MGIQIIKVVNKDCIHLSTKDKICIDYFFDTGARKQCGSAPYCNYVKDSKFKPKIKANSQGVGADNKGGIGKSTYIKEGKLTSSDSLKDNKEEILQLFPDINQ